MYGFCLCVLQSQMEQDLDEQEPGPIRSEENEMASTLGSSAGSNTEALASSGMRRLLPGCGSSLSAASIPN
jgi:hypothetical protein